MSPFADEVSGNHYIKASGFSINIEGQLPSIAHPTCRLVLINHNSEQSQDVHNAVIWSTGSAPNNVHYFSGGIDGLISMFEVSEDGSPTWWYPQVAIEINGVWQIDPVQCNPHIPSWQPHNFNFAWRWEK